jgi:hypothetical protein
MYTSLKKRRNIKNYSRWNIKTGGNFKITNINKINLDDFEKLPLNKTNPIICNNTFCVFKENGDFVLRDSRTDLNHSSFSIIGHKNKFVYINKIIDFVKNNNLIKKVCVLGFGLGGLPLELSQMSQIDKIDTVDIDVGMFKIYNSVIKNPSIKINYFVNDGLDFIKNINEKYDIIIDDAFDEKKVDYEYSSFYDKLNVNGFLIINLHDISTFNTETLKIYFKNIEVIHAKYNYLVICSK